MMEQEENLNPDEEFAGLLYQLKRLPYNDISGITAIEQAVYRLLAAFSQDLRGLIILLRIKIMLGDHAKAVATAEQIWEKGGNLDDNFEETYIDALLDLGLLEMASVMLKPRFENFSASLPFFYDVMLKFTLIGGSIKFLDKLTASPYAPRREDMIFDFIELYRLMNYGEHFKNIMKIMLEVSKNYLCGFGFNFYNDRGFTDLEIELYVEKDAYQNLGLADLIESKAEIYCTSASCKFANNLSFVVKNFAERPAKITA